MDVTYVFSCILLLVGVSTKKHLFMIPWLVYMFIIMLVIVTIIISFIIGLEDYASLAVFLGSSPVILCMVYIWVVVLSAYQSIRFENESARGPTSSASVSSLVSIKEGIQRVLGGTPPPPYEAVTTEVGSPKKKKKFGRQMSTESTTSNTVFFDISSTRRSSDETPSTKPASPTPFRSIQPPALEPAPESPACDVAPTLVTALTSPRPDLEALFSKSPRRMTSSVSQTNLCTRHNSPRLTMKKSSSSVQNFTRQLNFVNPEIRETVRSGKSTRSLVEGAEGQEENLLTTWSSLSDETSSMSTTSLDNANPHNILV